MILDPTRFGRAGSITAQQISRAGFKTVKKGFGQKLDSGDLLASLDNAHQKGRTSSTLAQLADSLDDYAGLAALIGLNHESDFSRPSGGSVLAAAIASLRAAVVGSAPGTSPGPTKAGPF